MPRESNSSPSSQPLVIGAGNPLRGDDGAGPAVACAVAARAASAARILLASGEGAALMKAWEGAERVILIDAARSGAGPGTIHCFEAHREPVPAQFLSCSTHAFSVAEAIEMARALGLLPARLTVYGIEGANFEFGEGLTPEVARAAREVEARILESLAIPSPGASHEATCNSSG